MASWGLPWLPILFQGKCQPFQTCVCQTAPSTHRGTASDSWIEFLLSSVWWNYLHLQPPACYLSLYTVCEPPSCLHFVWWHAPWWCAQESRAKKKTEQKWSHTLSREKQKHALPVLLLLIPLCSLLVIQPAYASPNWWRPSSRLL